MAFSFDPPEGPDREGEIGRLAALPRARPTRTNLLGRELEIPDGLSFVWTVPDVVERGVYLFPAEGDAPRIVDGGANVGLACLSWKGRWPRPAGSRPSSPIRRSAGCCAPISRAGEPPTSR